MREVIEIKKSRQGEKKLEVEIAIIGNPNTGKTTVFNALTGMHQKVGNYPGVTVEKKTGILKNLTQSKIRIHDLPGLYSLIPKSLDDKIATEVLMDRLDEPHHFKVVIVVADATNLARNLYLVTQIMDLGIPVILALNMMDIIHKRGLQIDVDKLSQKLNIPVIPLVANKNRGIRELEDAIEKITRNEFEYKPIWTIDSSMHEVISPIYLWYKKNSHLNETASWAEALRVLSSNKALENWMTNQNGSSIEHGMELKKIVKKARESLGAQDVRWHMFESKWRYDLIDEICKDAVQESDVGLSFSEKLDKILTHRVAGPIIFVFIFAVIFQSIFTWAEVPMNAIESSVKWFSVQMSAFLPDGALKGLVVDGAIAGVGAILVFLPQILFLFFFLTILEDTGYMARVAFIMDRFMRGIGLSGRSVIPLLSSFACAVPGIMATRTIQNWRDRLVTIMIAPFMSCSARLPVYTLMIAAFIPSMKLLGIFSLSGLTLLSMYLVGIISAIVVAYVFKFFVVKKQRSSTFVMELPPYRIPSPKWVLLQMYERGKIFVLNAGQIILAISIVLWFLASYPKPDHANNITSTEAIQQSYAGQIGRFIEPAIEPLGFDWKIGIGLITSFAAREVMVSTLATIYNVEGADESSVSLRDALRKAKNPKTGQPVFTPLVAVALMIFFVLACQCMATVAIVKRETNSWRWPITMVLYMTTMAYIGSLIVYQGGKLLGLG